MLLNYLVFIPLFMGVATERIGSQWYGYINPQHVVPGQIIKLEAPWVEIEKTNDIYTYPSYLDSNIQFSHITGNPVILLFKGSPYWARNTDYQCSLPSYDFWDEYLEFLLKTIDRYKPIAVEIWNEPEAAVSSGELFWCCGCVENPQDYVNLLNYLYPKIKQRFPNLIILGGALTQNDSLWAREFLSNRPLMDALSWHYYSWAYPNQTSVSTKDLINRINELSIYGYPQWLTETAHVCNLADCGNSFRSLQSDWINAVFQVSGIEKIIWFTTPFVNWASCEMISSTGNPYPVWYTFVDTIRKE